MFHVSGTKKAWKVRNDFFHDVATLQQKKKSRWNVSKLHWFYGCFIWRMLLYYLRWGGECSSTLKYLRIKLLITISIQPDLTGDFKNYRFWRLLLLRVFPYIPFMICSFICSVNDEFPTKISPVSCLKFRDSVSSPSIHIRLASSDWPHGLCLATPIFSLAPPAHFLGERTPNNRCASCPFRKSPTGMRSEGNRVVWKEIRMDYGPPRPVQSKSWVIHRIIYGLCMDKIWIIYG